MICNFLIFDNLGSRYDPYMGYSGLHRRILLCHFFKKWKNLPKVHVLWPILFQILYWSFFCSPFWSIRSHLRKKIAKTAENSAKIALAWTQFSRDWDRNRKNPTIEISASFLWFWNAIRLDSISYGVFKKVSFVISSISTSMCVGVDQIFFRQIF